MAQQVEDLIGDAVFDQGGDKIGKVKRVYIDNSSGAPTWASVSTGFFSDDSLVPLAGARLHRDSGEIRVRVDKAAVKSAPHLERDGVITPESEDELFVHYGIDPGVTSGEDYGRHAERTGGDAEGADGTAGMAASTTETGIHEDPEPSEEHLNIDTEHREAGRVEGIDRDDDQR